MVFWIFALLAIIAVFLLVASMVLPKLFLYNRCALTHSCDRGIKRKLSGDGQGVLYEPSPSVRKYIKKYVITLYKGNKVLVCKLDRAFKYLDYDIVVFNSDNKVQCILNVKELPKETGYTRVIKLPDETAYVSLHLNTVDNKTFESRVLERASFWRVLIFSLCSAALMAVTVLGVRVCFINIFGGLFAESLMVESESTIFTIIISSAVAVVDIVLTLVLVLIKNYKFAGKKERNTL